MPITTAEEKAQRRLEVKARSTLMIGILNEHQLNFNSIKDAKQLLEAVEKRFGGNATTKKTQRNILKQQFENFFAPSSKMLDQTFDMLQKLVSQLELLDIDTMSMDDLYNNLKVYKPEVKRMSSSNSNTQNMAFLSSTNSSTNEAVNISQAVNTGNRVSTASTQVDAAFSKNIDNLSDRWKIAMLTMRSIRFLKKTGKKLSINGNKTIGFNKSNVECFNFYKWGHFARECRAPRNQDNKHKENTRTSVPVETPTSKALVLCDGLGGYD
nr:hypothetical protein [Tanacetum cinerariifolium]